MNLNFAAIDVTYRCNLCCKHCYNSSGGDRNIKTDELTDLELIEVATQIANAHPESICFCGGEPLLRKEALLSATRTIKSIDKKINVNMVTNAYLFNDGDYAQIKDAGMTMVQVSLDASKAETHDWMRNKTGVFLKAVHALERLKAAGLMTAVSFVPTRKNMNEVDEAISLCASLGVHSFRVQPLMLLGRTNEHLLDYVLSDSEYRAFIRKIMQRKKQYIVSGGMEIMWGDPVNHLLNLETNVLQPSFVITASGELLLSPYIPISFGNITSHCLQDYINAGLFNQWTGRLYTYLTRFVISPKTMDLQKFFPDGIECIDMLDHDFKEKEEKLLDRLRKFSESNMQV